MRWQNAANKGELLSLAAMLLWQIWKCRNGASFDDKITIPEVVSKRAVSHLREHIAANQLNAAHNGDSTNTHNEHIRPEASWRKPGVDFYKINVDVVWNKERLKGSVGAVIRNCRGDFIAATIWMESRVVLAHW